MQECSVAAPYGGSLYRESQCTEYPVQKPVKKCAKIPKQSCVKRRQKHKCKEVTKQVCRLAIKDDVLFREYFYRKLSAFNEPTNYLTN